MNRSCTAILALALCGSALAAQQAPAGGIASPYCAPGITDAATGTCLSASSAPVLGDLYPLSTDFFVSASGNVGIGTTLPGFKLDVAGSTRINGTLQFRNGTGPLTYLFETGTQNAPRAICAHSPAFPTWGIFYEDVSDSVLFQSSSRETLRVSLGSGKVGIGNSSPSRTLHVGSATGDGIAIGSSEYFADAGSNLLSCGAALWPAAGNPHTLGSATNCWSSVWSNFYVTCSDERVKSEVRDAHYGLAEVLQLRPVTYVLHGRTDDGPRLGLIAQEVLPVVSEVVATHHYEVDEETGVQSRVANESLGIDYGALVPVVIKAIQEQQSILARQHAAIAEQQRLLAEQRALTAALAERIVALERR